MNFVNLADRLSKLDFSLPRCAGGPRSLSVGETGPWSRFFPSLGVADRWQPAPGLVTLSWKDAGVDLATCAAGLVIMLAVTRFLVHQRDNPFAWALAGFGTLALLIGVEHAIEALRGTLPLDRLAGFVKVLTAACSWAVVIATVRLIRLIRRTEQRQVDLQIRLDAASGLISRLEAEGDQIKRANLRLADLSETDELTGLKNRRHFLGSFQAAFASAQAEGRSLSLVMLDVDHFKAFNDHLGHQAGDDLLQMMATVLREHVRPSDLIARYGGEEFMILLPDTDAATGCAVAERLRAVVADHPWPIRPVTASFGVATSQPGLTCAAELIAAADIALYRSKAAGRDQVTHGQETPLQPAPNRAAEAPAPPLTPAA